MADYFDTFRQHFMDDARPRCRRTPPLMGTQRSRMMWATRF